MSAGKPPSVSHRWEVVQKVREETPEWHFFRPLLTHAKLAAILLAGASHMAESRVRGEDKVADKSVLQGDQWYNHIIIMNTYRHSFHSGPRPHSGGGRGRGHYQQVPGRCSNTTEGTEPKEASCKKSHFTRALMAKHGVECRSAAVGRENHAR